MEKISPKAFKTCWQVISDLTTYSSIHVLFIIHRLFIFFSKYTGITNLLKGKYIPHEKQQKKYIQPKQICAWDLRLKITIMSCVSRVQHPVLYIEIAKAEGSYYKHLGSHP